jgi:hypothetical protein
MKKKILKVLAFITAMALIAVFAVFADGLIGNPVSRFLARRDAVSYLAEKYPGTDYEIEKVTYDFKSGGYHVGVISPSSADSHFNLSYDRLGRLKYDNYNEYVAGRLNVQSRLEREYRELTDRVFDSPFFPYDCDIKFGTLSIYPKAEIKNGDDPDEPSVVMPVEALVLDKVYDIRELGEKYGKLVVYANSDTVTVEKAAEIMLGIKEAFLDAGVPFRAIDFTLQYPKDPEKGWIEGEVYVSGFLIEDIYAEGMTERVRTANDELKAYYDSQDSKQ